MVLRVSFSIIFHRYRYLQLHTVITFFSVTVVDVDPVHVSDFVGHRNFSALKAVIYKFVVECR